MDKICLAEIIPAIILAADSWRDIRSKKIFAWLTLAAGGCGAVMNFLESVWMTGTLAGKWSGTAFQGLSGTGAAAVFGVCLSLVPGLLLIAVSMATEGKVGMGDGIAVCMIGGWTGFWCALISLLGALALVAGLGMMECIIRAMSENGPVMISRNRAVPFIPFLLCGYLIVLAFRLL